MITGKVMFKIAFGPHELGLCIYNKNKIELHIMRE